MVVRGERLEKVITVSAVMIVIIVLPLILTLNLLVPLAFDDAYMFYRYAMNVRNGLGVSWNPDGVHTYGLTSHAWLGIVLLFTFLPVSPAHALQLASWLIGVVALTLIFYGVIRRTSSAWSLTITSAGIATLVTLSKFTFHLTTGMDTMLAFGVNGLLVFLVLSYLEMPSFRRSVGLGVVAFLAVIIRPDNGVCALGGPVLAWLFQADRRNWRNLIGLVLLPVVLIAIFVSICYLYYGVPLPLSFYAKSANSYVGFQGRGSSVGYFIDFFTCLTPFVLVICMAGIRKNVAIIFFVPVVITIAYFLTVNQIMGWFGRFYIPLLPFVMIPSLLSLDEFAAAHRKLSLRRVWLTSAMVVGCIVTFSSRDWIVERHLEASLPEPVPLPSMPITAREPLPEIEWFENISRFSEDVVKRLPKGTVIAASEVGYLGLSAPNAKIIDLVGLNDAEIGRHGVNVSRLVKRAPDLVWMPHTHYTGIRASILSSQSFHEHYIFIDGAYNYGLAIRRGSPHRSRIEFVIKRAWPRVYQDRLLDDYVVHTSRGQFDRNLAQMAPL